MPKLPFEFQPMVDKGCKLLDERLGPEWVEKIDLRQLQLASNCDCVLGQLSIDVCGVAHSYEDACIGLFREISDDSVVEHGFLLASDDNPRDYEPLTKCWTLAISARRAEL